LLSAPPPSRQSCASCSPKDFTRDGPKVFRPQGRELPPGCDPGMPGEREGREGAEALFARAKLQAHDLCTRSHRSQWSRVSPVILRVALQRISNGLSRSAPPQPAQHVFCALLLHSSSSPPSSLRPQDTRALSTLTCQNPNQSAAELECFLFCLTGPKDK